MKKNNRLQTLLIIAAVFTFSSCNRGYGCPTNFSIQEFVVDLAQVVSAFLF